MRRSPRHPHPEPHHHSDRAIAVGGGAPSFVASGTSLSHKSLTLDGNDLYWVDDLLVGRVPKAGGAAVILNEDPPIGDPNDPATIAVLRQSLAWTHPAIGAVEILTK